MDDVEVSDVTRKGGKSALILEKVPGGITAVLLQLLEQFEKVDGAWRRDPASPKFTAEQDMERMKRSVGQRKQHFKVCSSIRSPAAIARWRLLFGDDFKNHDALQRPAFRKRGKRSKANFQ